MAITLPTNNEKFLTLAEVCQFLSTTPKTFKALASKNNIAPVVLAKRKLYKLSDINSKLGGI